MCRTLKQILVVMMLSAPGFIGAWAATTVAEAAPAAASAALTVVGTVAQIGASEDLQRAALARLEQSARWRELARSTAALEADFDRLEVNRAAQAELVELLGLEHRAWALEGAASAIVDELSSILRRLEQDRSALETEARMWQERLPFLPDRLVPALVLDRARAVEVDLRTAGDRAREVRDSALLEFVNAFTLQARIVEAGARISGRLEHVRAERMELETSSLWQLGAAHLQFGLVASELRTGNRLSREYLAESGARLAGLFFGILVLTWWLLSRRSLQEAGPAERAYGHPVAASVLIALMSLWWLAP